MKAIIEDKPTRGCIYNNLTINGPAPHPAFKLVCRNTVAGGQYGITAQWSGREFPAPPDVGTKVRVTCNSIGVGVIEDYFIEHGYIGVRVKLDPETRAEWHKKQNGDKDYCLVFGNEIVPV
jgi:hypothetical protein